MRACVVAQLFYKWKYRRSRDLVYVITSKLDILIGHSGQILAEVISTYLTLINRAGGLYGRILTEVVSTDRTRSVHNDRGQDSPIQTGYARLKRCLLYGANKNNLIRSM